MEKKATSVAKTSYELADIGTRIGAGLIDLFLPLVLALPFGIVFGRRYHEIFTLIIGIIFIGWFVLHIVLLVKRSQSIGMHLLNIQALNVETKKRCGFWRYFLLREFVGKTLVIGALPILNLVVQPLYFLIDSAFIFRNDRRTVHDMIGGTIIIKLPAGQERKEIIDLTVLPK